MAKTLRYLDAICINTPIGDSPFSHYERGKVYQVKRYVVNKHEPSLDKRTSYRIKPDGFVHDHWDRATHDEFVKFFEIVE